MPGSIQVSEPAYVRLSGLDRGKLEACLSYADRRVDWEVQRFRQPWNVQRYVREHGEDAFREALEQLRASRQKTCLMSDDRGDYTYSGLTSQLLRQFPDAQVSSSVSYPSADLLAWKQAPTSEPRPYQLAMRDALLSARHGAVEVGTGLGKTLSLQLVVKEMGLRSVVMAPSRSIARQLYDQMVVHFGKAKVGLYGDGRKDVGKLVTVGIDDSLTRVEEGSDAWEHFSDAPVYCVDESHLTPAESLKKVALGLMVKAPYRFFFSGTQLRTDGLDLVLEGLVGPVVYQMTVKEGVDQGYLAKPAFRVVEVRCPSLRSPRDVGDATRRCLYYNPEVNRLAGAVVNQMVALKRPTLVLVDEVAQFAQLLPHLQVQAAFAHGPLTKSNKGDVPEPYWESDPPDLVDRFNRGQIPCLVGTSCISTGTDVRVNECTVYLVGGQSEIAVRQGAVGRSTRGGRLGGVVNPWTGQPKLECAVVDFDVLLAEDLEEPLPGEKRKLSAVHRHALERAKLYRESYPDLERVRL